MRARIWVSRAWEAGNPSPAIFGGKGTGAQTASWQVSFAAEVAALSEQVHAASLLDLVRAFETVPHAILASKAVEAAYNLVILRLSLAAYRAGPCPRY